MRIVHVFDTAGVGCILSKYQTLAGHEASVIWKDDVIDKYGIYNFYKKFMKLYPNDDFTGKLINECKDADIVHVHSNIYALIKLRKSLGPEKKIILHYHGTDIRGLKKQKIPLSEGSFLTEAKVISKFLYRKIFHRLIHSNAQKFADLICISQIDLSKLVPSAVYIPIAVDTSHFSMRKEEVHELRKVAVTIKTEVTDMQLVLDHYGKNNIGKPLEVYDRTIKPIMYKDMPSFLKRYETYVDIRFVNGKILGDLSSTALQSLACGLKVISYDLRYLESLPQEYEASNVVSRVLHFYEKLLQK
jgi:hypothetical protein